MAECYAEIAIPCPVRQVFDYIIPTEMDLKPGMRVKIPFGRRVLTGIVIRIKTESAIKSEIKCILEQLDQEPLIPPDLIQLGVWTAHYYQHPIGDVFASMLPSRLRQGKTLNIARTNLSDSKNTHSNRAHILSEEQSHAVQSIINYAQQFNVFLLHGITGSGKTEVYFQVIEKVIKKNQQVLFLIPEISLSPQTVQRFINRFASSEEKESHEHPWRCHHHIAVMHSGLTDKQRLTAWAHARSGEAKIIIGTRSAVFTPFNNLALIIIDEEHDASFKQQEGFRYSARDVAIKRAYDAHIPIILGSATPSSESYQNALNKKYQLLELTQRAGGAKPPIFELIHADPKTLENGLASKAIKKIELHLARQEQVLIFINRRGYAPIWFCQSCHWQAQCTRCDSHLVLHKKDRKLICHHCGHQKSLTHTCPKCHSHSLLALGEGTQRIAESIESHFPNTSIIRVDRDTIKNKHQLETQLDNIRDQQAAILIGTQMLAKGHHFSNVTLVVILGIDNGLMSHDFHALENTAQLIMQVSGRAGRENKPGLVLLQTLQPEHPQLKLLIEKSYTVFLKTLLKERKQFKLPPFAYLALFRLEAKQQSKAQHGIETLHTICKSLAAESCILLYDPVPAPIQRKAGFYLFQLLVQSNKRSLLQQFLSNILPILSTNSILKSVRWTLDVDPIDLL